ncbi:hypothetical protein ACJX0J_024996, partial [Zea mays]
MVRTRVEYQEMHRTHVNLTQGNIIDRQNTTTVTYLFFNITKGHNTTSVAYIASGPNMFLNSINAWLGKEPGTVDYNITAAATSDTTHIVLYGPIELATQVSNFKLDQIREMEG